MLNDDTMTGLYRKTKQKKQNRKNKTEKQNKGRVTFDWMACQ